MEFVPDLPAVDWGGCDHEILDWVEVCLVGVGEVGVVLEEVLELVWLGLELAVLVLEHADGATSVDD